MYNISKDTMNMKRLSILVLVLAFAHGIVKGDGDATSLVIALLFFSSECGKDISRIWRDFIYGNEK